MELKALDGDKWTYSGAREGFPILVEYARLGKPITYGGWNDERLRRKLGASKDPRSYNHPAGAIGNACAEYARATGTEVPPLNLLVINKTTKLPGEGADEYFRLYALRAWKMKVNPSKMTDEQLKSMRDRVHKEIYAFPDWEKVMTAYGLKPSKKTRHRTTTKRKRPKQSGWHTGPESQAHKDLKCLIRRQPNLVGLPSRLKGENEQDLWSGDRVDVYFEKADVAVEVKTRGAGYWELHRGIFQCVKYKAVLEAQQIHDGKIPAADCILAAGGPLPGDLCDLAELLGVKWFDELL